VAAPDDPPVPTASCDGGDLDCGSGLLLVIRSAMQPLAPGAVLEVKSREGSVREDLPAWCRLVGHALVAERDGDAGYRHYFVRKKLEDAELTRDLQRARDHRWQARVRWSGGMQAKVSVRNHVFAIGQPASFDTADPAPSAVEYLLGAVGGALATGFQWRARMAGIETRNLEVVVRARSADILVFLGVEAGGDPGLTAIESTIYVDADAEPAQLDAILADTLRRCPVVRSLQRAVPVQARWQAV
jgi:uncharacterized OsmC-like protein/TusA-related sulfurtransferase